ncbi:Sporulenol synthase [Maioricimonas rarisocia]|uniref:Sporulenol synthase n=1 Tax=Maioricimonas rarisocia TaxID=2528026 RepID=A0A517ZDY5_9PLAN|nr:prenyltransferase/squalene oxidase repeat-containing protein [Maioricimonas rarisocia]QDU40687.1 Sporulenol synthase [Maioricimonas rarisocia]
MRPSDPADRIEQAFQTVRETLLADRNRAGHWEGELSTSALSTATAVMALEMVRRDGSSAVASAEQIAELIDGGLRWLASHQNENGGWGDTTLSVSNISTSMLAHAVFHATGRTDDFPDVVKRAADYVDRCGGVPAVVARYGKDRTFSVPILTHCALAGLVDWKEITPLPFELSCLPARFYKTVRLPVVSYALPALIAIGQVRHHHRKPWFLPWRWVRNAARKPSLRVLERIQPEGGGFLEATPLTSFVTMSLAGMGLGDHPVARRGLQFIIDSVRPDGSWPIDTNLATWVTTLSVNALEETLPAADRESIARWLLEQQYRTVHPYTNADPGGWAWTDLPGGVPDADDTPGAMLAVMRLFAAAERDGQSPEAWSVEGTTVDACLTNAARWLLDLQNRDGGWPTFCRGWGTLPFDRSSADITAHGLRALHEWTAWCAARSGCNTADEVSGLLRRARSAIQRGFQFLSCRQREDGSWLPLWFGNQFGTDDENPLYGTTRVLAAYRDCARMDAPAARRGFDWLRSQQNEDGGWGGARGIPSSVEETALATEILLADPAGQEHALRGLDWLVERIEDGRWTAPTPIGFYFAKLWYFERLYPMVFTVAALRQAREQATSGTAPALTEQM